MAKHKTMWLWVPEDQGAWGAPRVIQIGTKPPKPGKVYAVSATSADHARRIYALLTQPEPDRKTQKADWLAWDTAQDKITEVKDTKDRG